MLVSQIRHKTSDAAAARHRHLHKRKSVVTWHKNTHKHIQTHTSELRKEQHLFQQTRIINQTESRIEMCWHESVFGGADLHKSCAIRTTTADRRNRSRVTCLLGYFCGLRFWLDVSARETQLKWRKSTTHTRMLFAGGGGNGGAAVF